MATSRTGTAKWKNLRRRVLHTAQAQGLTHCPHCRTWLDYTKGRRPNSAEVDHIIPHSRGGQDHPDNCTVLCRRCNQSKGNTTHTKRGTTPQTITLTTSNW